MIVKGRGVQVAAGMTLALLAGCLQSDVVLCGTIACPPGYVCADGDTGCVLPEQLRSCDGVAEGGPCSYPGVAIGGCRGGRCLPISCGDGVVTSPEDCEESNLGGKSCTDLGFYEPDGLACGSDCSFDLTGCRGWCGDDERDPVEQCDGDDLDGTTCTQLGYYGGTAACSARCTFDVSGCMGRCGDGVRTLGEACDGVDLGGATPACADFGFYAGGPVTCNSLCGFDVSACSQSCGDGIRNVPEQCDGANLGPSPPTCLDLGFYTGGPVTCNALCGFDASACSETCGDGRVNGPEGCDGTNLGASPPNCSDFGFYSGGPVTCNPLCGFDSSQCSESCGDGIVNGGESCDGTNLAGADCQTLGYYNAPGLACNGVCTYDASSCSGYCGDRIANGGESCDGSVPAAQCLDYGFESGTMGCAVCGVDFSECTGTYTRDVSTTDRTLFSVWGSGPSDVFAVGETDSISAALIHWNGTAWATMSPGTNRRLYGVWGSGPTDVFAVGHDGVIQHWNGSVWTSMTSGTTSRLYGVWGSGPSDVFAIGDGGTIVHWNGSTWSATASGTTQPLTAIWGTGPSDVFVVGNSGTAIRWNGASWSAMPSLPAVGWGSVWGTATDHVIAVSDTNAGFVYRWNGTAWTQIASGPVSSAQLGGVWGTGPNDVFAVGLISGMGGTIFHYNGSVWTQIATGISTSLLRGVWGTGPDEVFVVGSGGTAVRWTGSMWLPMKGGASSLLGVWGTASNDVFAVGVSGVIEHYDGSAWTPMTSGTTAPLNEVWGSGPSNVFTVGRFGTILRWTGSQWDPTTSGTANELFAVWGSGPSDVFAGGEFGTMLHWNGSAWSPMSVPASTHIRGIWGSGPNDVFATGFTNSPNTTYVLHWNGTLWSVVYSAGAGAGQLNGIWGTGPSDVFTAGTSPLRHWNGATWAPVSTPSAVSAIAGTGPADVFAVGGSGAIVHWDGSAWSSMRSGTTSSLTGVWASASGDVFAVGLSGVKLRRPRACAAVETTCSDGTDEDCDGQVDCADADCIGNGACTSGGLCTGYIDVACNVTLPGTTAGAPSRIERSGCDTALRSGRERVYRLPASTAGTVTATLTNPSRDLDVVVLQQTAAGGCDPLNPGCKTVSANTGLSTDSVTFTAVVSDRYYVVVDGYSPFGATFTLSVACP